MKKAVCPFCGKKAEKFMMFRGDIVGCQYCGINIKQTNADRIRAMTDEELAEKWWAWIDCGECPARPNCSMLHKDCNQFALDWLKKEVDDG